ncbi:MAG: FG-GAP-like repeat-containing protein [Bifidobacteriaceae bacterium]|nr:FG-GAP-like repeat-containing protein [Bifidobacteriaceae bacterium]
MTFDPISPAAEAAVAPEAVKSSDDVPEIPSDVEPLIPQGYGVTGSLALVFAEKAIELLGDRLVDISATEDEGQFQVGVYQLTDDEKAELETELSQVADAVVVDRPVKESVLASAVNATAERLADYNALVAPDYATGSIIVTVTPERIDAVVNHLAEQPVVVQDGAADTAVQIPASVVEGPEVRWAEDYNTTPPKAGKYIYIGSTAACTANALVQTSNGTKYSLTAGHCTRTGDSVRFAGTSTAGTTSYSSFDGSPSVVTVDAARFSTPSTTVPQVYIGNDSSRAITSKAMPYVNQANVCFYGATTHTEICGTVYEVNTSLTPSPGSTGTQNQSWFNVGSGWLCSGDSGAPVYQKASGGTASLLGIVSLVTVDRVDPDGKFCGHSIGFTPIDLALSASSTSLVLTPGLNVPPPQSISTPFAQLMVSPDFTYDSRGEVVGVDTEGKLIAYRSTAAGYLTGMDPPGQIGAGWTSLRAFPAGDWSGDGVYGDFIAINSSGYMYLYRGAGGGRFVSGSTQIGSGWASYDPAVMGDLNGDGKSDIVARNTSTGYLYLYPGNGSGGFLTQSTIGSGWTTVKPYAAGDLDGDGKRDMLGLSSAGQLRRYYGNGSGGFGTAYQVGTGWATYTLASGGVSIDSGSAPDIVGRDNATGKLYLYPGNGAGGFPTKTQIGGGW